ncbi:radical SAM protein [Alkaliphilus peptidifermentans]|uniref:Radical SAM superfamily enzyme, MoaA/NifB/PqqE/SkfB family n=1 Tax=Alkaliphilus peptidifermentans DSM 18978 TaxID=1120976 RepID=A0A1G5LAH5_9FIRM|nr:radical SAM protein [Alkaliphilus peptidifermentans]SCZ09451.1 Radical SAM superfamily enzyme, MoaA/NifB/PqqE/SkfB family [Alkaliphilus peptidifermentans DSM 18978]
MEHTVVKSCSFGIPKEGIKVVWEITNKCQMNCIHCCNEHRRTGEDISLEDAIKKVGELSKKNVSKIIFTGGDPLLYKDIFDLIEYVNKFNIKVCISTNGMLLDDYYNEIITVSPEKIIIGLDGLSESTHDKFRGCEDAFTKVIKGVENLIPHKSIKIELHSIVSKMNIHEIEQIIEFSKTKDIKLNLANLLEIENKPLIKDYILTNEDYNLYLDEINSEKHEHVRHIRKKKGLLEKCFAGSKIIGIRADGIYTPCIWLSNYTQEFDTDCLESLFNTSKLFKEFDNSFCNHCTVEGCGKGCLAAILSSEKRVDPLCVISENFDPIGRYCFNITLINLLYFREVVVLC